MLEGVAEMEKSRPVPLNETACGPPSPLSAMARVPEIAPAVPGSKAIST
jgi:hypothetical protein